MYIVHPNRKYGWKKTKKPDRRNYKLMPKTKGVNLPPSVDLRSVMAGIPVFDQGQLGSCFHPDTEIPILDGTTKTLKELYDSKQSFWVYSLDENLKVVPGKAVCNLTGKDKNLIKITLDNNDEILCTPDHQFMQRDGSYVEAQNLKNGDSLMPLYRKSDKPYNYKVKNIEVAKETSDVYCLTVDKHHNFALQAGVFVHNCTANAWSVAFNFAILNMKNEMSDHFVPSRLFIYYNERLLEGSVESDSGAEVGDGGKVLAKQGVCEEEEWNYIENKFAIRPPDACYTHALKHEALTYWNVNQDLDTMKGCLADGFPFVLGFSVYTSFEGEEVAKSGIVPMPKPDEENVGGHAVLCLHGDTKIPLLDGSSLSITELLSKYGTGVFWVYSCDNGHIVPGIAHSLRKTGVDRELVEIILDNNEKIKCTPDHLIMMRDGNYKPAGELKSGDSLMPFYRKKDQERLEGYEMVLHPNTHKWQYTHRMVASKDGRYKGVVHHKDYDKKNNTPENLQVMTWEDHTKLHYESAATLINYAKSEKGREKSREIMRKLWNDPIWKAKRLIQNAKNGKVIIEKLKAENRCGFQGMSEDEHKNAIEKAMLVRRIHGPYECSETTRGKLSNLFNCRFNNDTEFRQRVQQVARQNWTEYNEKIQNGELTISDKTRIIRSENMKKIHEHMKQNPEMYKRKGFKTAWTRWHKEEYPCFDDYLASIDEKVDNSTMAPNNHKVIAVVPAGCADVYDLTVEKYHNFATDAGVFVHNCVGYNDATQSFLVRNSWGSEWGQEGHFWIPYEYLTNPNLAADFWTLRTVSGTDHNDGVPGIKTTWWQSLLRFLHI